MGGKSGRLSNLCCQIRALDTFVCFTLLPLKHDFQGCWQGSQGSHSFCACAAGHCADACRDPHQRHADLCACRSFNPVDNTDSRDMVPHAQGAAGGCMEIFTPHPLHHHHLPVDEH